jgi:hypothetical protein
MEKPMTINTKYLALLAALLLPVSAFAQIQEVNPNLTTAVFNVYKHWNQNGVPITEPVDVHIVCTGGDPLTNQTTISVAQNGSFMEQDIPTPQGVATHNCTITEDVPDNYTAEYQASGPNVQGKPVFTDTSDDFAGCLFEDIPWTEGRVNIYRCDIWNTPDPGTLTVTKTWILAGADQGFDGEYEIKSSCDSEVYSSGDNCGKYIDDPQSNDPEDLICASDLPSDDPDYVPELYDYGSKCKSGGNCYAWVKSSAGKGNIDFEFTVDEPNFGGSDCTLEESFDDSVVESQNDCSDPETIEAGDSVSCEIVNTVFFEGIPTLNQYGMAILALLMLGVGFVGFRRFV